MADKPLARKDTTLDAIIAASGFQERMKGYNAGVHNKELKRENQRCIKKLVDLLR